MLQVVEQISNSVQSEWLGYFIGTIGRLKEKISGRACMNRNIKILSFLKLCRTFYLSNELTVLYAYVISRVCLSEMSNFI